MSSTSLEVISIPAHALSPAVGELVDGCGKFTGRDVADHSINLVAQVVFILESLTLEVAFDVLEQPVIAGGDEVGTVPRVQSLVGVVTPQVVLDQTGSMRRRVVLLESPILPCPMCWSTPTDLLTELAQQTEMHTCCDTLPPGNELPEDHTLGIPKH